MKSLVDGLSTLGYLLFIQLYPVEEHATRPEQHAYTDVLEWSHREQARERERGRDGGRPWRAEKGLEESDKHRLSDCRQTVHSEKCKQYHRICLIAYPVVVDQWSI